MNRYQLQRIARNHYNGNERNPESNALYDGRQRARETRIRATFEVLGPNYQAQAPSDEEIAAMPRQQSCINYGREEKIRLLETEYSRGSMRTFKKARRDMKHERAAHNKTIKPGTPMHNYFLKTGRYNFQNEDGSLDKTFAGKRHLDYKRQKARIDRESLKHAEFKIDEPADISLENKLNSVARELELARERRRAQYGW